MTLTPYDQNDYYRDDEAAPRLARWLTPLLGFMDALRAHKTAGRVHMETGNVLDIGAGDGSFLHHMQRRGFTPFGTTASQVSRSVAQRKFKLDLVYGDGVPDVLRKRRYDMISYWHVFEHLERPEDHARLWDTLLAPRGRVILEVPNPDSLGAGLCFDSWLGSDPQHHVNMRTRSEIESLAGRYGFRVTHAEAFSLKFTCVYLWSALLGRWFGPSAYSFDTIMSCLQSPASEIRKAPLKTGFAFLSAALFLPVILTLAAWGIMTDRGEVLYLVMERAHD